MKLVVPSILLVFILASCELPIDPAHIEISGFSIVGWGDDGWGECRYDPACEPICEGNVAWTQSCDPREGMCFKSFDTVCAGQMETFGEHGFPKRCSQGECVRDDQAITQTKRELETQMDRLREEYVKFSGVRRELIVAKDEAYDACVREFSATTGILMDEMATVQTGLVAGSESFAMDSVVHVTSWLAPVDLIEEGLNRASVGDRMSLEDFIALNCMLNEHFGRALDDSDAIADEYVRVRRETLERYDALP